MPAQAQFGERVPVPVTTFSPIATGGVNQQPITSFNYENIGVNIDITPRTHMNNDVTLALTISVTSISGTGFGGLPTFGNRLIKTTIRLKDGETNMLAGLIRDDERKVRDGIPGLSDIPGVGHLFGHSSNERQQTDVILMLTPRIVRVLELTEEDLRAFQMGTRCRSRRHRRPVGVGGPRRRRRCSRCRMQPPAPNPATDAQRRRRSPAAPSSRRSPCCRRRRSRKRRPTPGKRPRRVRHASGAASGSWRVRCAHGTGVGYSRPQRTLHLRSARSRLGRSRGCGFSTAATISTKPASRSLSRPGSITSPCNGESGAPAASLSRCRCRTRRQSSTI